MPFLRFPVLMLLCVAPALAVQGQAAENAQRPRLVVFLTVDQLRPDYLTRWRDQLSGGLRRLVDEGAFFERGLQDHGITETAPGHASTLSGRFPYSTGISSNSAGVNTNDVSLVEAEGVGASPARFQGTTLADWMTTADPRTKVLSVSRKDRGAILPVGRGQHTVLWYAQRSGRFTTSTWYGDTLPAWVRAFNDERPVFSRYAGKTWTLLLPDSMYPEPDSVPAESGGQGFLFPHLMATSEEIANQMVIGMPWMDELTLDLAWRGVNAMQLGSGPQTDLLAVSLSTMDAVGHRFGPDSREVHDFVLRLDQMLAPFLDSLVARYGEGGVALALTADHAVAPALGVKSTFGDNSKAIRLARDALTPAFDRLVPILRRGDLPYDAFGFDAPEFTVDRSRTVGKNDAVLAVARAFKREAERVRGVLRVDVIDDLVRADTVKDDIARRWLHMFRPGGSTIAVVTLDPYSYYGTAIASHGTPHDYDATVPIIFWGRPFRQLRDDGKARVVDIAPTLAAMLGVTPTEELDGVVLQRALRAPPR
ncbi:MAG: alkaline phosphatase family protein [Gemmatimonadaceae bacterium]|nr:alkaline phosphatase family protein [Gemmatimonadaceae bacterium]